VLAEYLRGQVTVMGSSRSTTRRRCGWPACSSRADRRADRPADLRSVSRLRHRLVLALLVALLQFATWQGVMLVLVVYGIGQLLESFVLTPWLVGERIGLHPLAVIFALLAFGQLFGFTGVLLALPAPPRSWSGCGIVRTRTPAARCIGIRDRGAATDLRAGRTCSARLRQFPHRRQRRSRRAPARLRGRTLNETSVLCGARAEAARAIWSRQRSRSSAACGVVHDWSASLCPKSSPERCMRSRTSTIFRGGAGAALHAVQRMPGARCAVADERADAALAAPLRDDLRTRAGWGLVLELKPLADADKPAALAAYARGHGFRSPAEVIGFLLSHVRRDMGTLLVDPARARPLFALDQAPGDRAAGARTAAAGDGARARAMPTANRPGDARCA
jgi:hypothetical protein